MKEKYTMFKLAYCSTLIQDPLLSTFGLSGKLPVVSQLVHSCTSPKLDDLLQLLSLFHNNKNYLAILSSLTCDQ